MTHARRLFPAALLLAAAANAQSLTELPIGPNWSGASAARISADGILIAGSATTPNAGRPYWCDTEAATELPVIAGGIFAIANAISADGQSIVGASAYQHGPGTHAVLWTRSGFMQDLGTLTGFEAGTAGAYGVSADGSVIVGQSSSTEPGGAFRWTAGLGMINLGSLGPNWGSAAYAVSADGMIIVGASTSSTTTHAFRWTAADGMQDLGLLSGTTFARALDISPDGTVIIGACGLDATSVAVRWTAAGPQPLGSLAGFTNAEALAASTSGAVIVGDAYTASAQRRAFIWTQTTGMLDLAAYLNSRGLSTAGWTLERARGISPDGLRIVGDGTHNGLSRAFLISLPCLNCCAGDFNHDGDSGTDADIEAFFFCLAGSCCATCDPADYNGDGDSGTDADVEAFFRVLAGGPC